MVLDMRGDSQSSLRTSQHFCLRAGELAVSVCDAHTSAMCDSADLVLLSDSHADLVGLQFF